MWTWGSWCSHCVISQRLAGSPSPWSKPGISKPWTLLELQVGADNVVFTQKGVLRQNTKTNKIKRPIVLLSIVCQCIMALLIDLFFLQIHMWRYHWCARAGGWRRGRLQPNATLSTQCTTKLLCLMFLLRTLTKSACSLPSWTMIGWYIGIVCTKRIRTAIWSLHLFFFSVL